MLSEKAKKAHVDLYKNYVKSFNETSVRLDSVDKSKANNTNSEFRNLQVNLTYNLNAVYLHELYLANISDVNSEIPMDSLAFMRLSRDFGTFDNWQKDFIACCLASRTGWACTVFSTYLQRFINITIDEHASHVLFGSYPVIVMDMWEHAYYKDYLNNKKAYVTNMMRELNWKIIETRVKRADMILKALG